MRHALTLLLGLAASAGLHAQNVPVPSQPQPQGAQNQPLEQAINVHSISQMQRAAQPEKTVPDPEQAPLEVSRVRDDLLIESRLLVGKAPQPRAITPQLRQDNR